MDEKTADNMLLPNNSNAEIPNSDSISELKAKITMLHTVAIIGHQPKEPNIPNKKSMTF